MKPCLFLVSEVLLKKLGEFTGLFLLLCCALLSACSTRMKERSSALTKLFSSKVDFTLTTPLNPSLTYLRVSVYGQTGLLVLGYTDDHPMGPITVWYSSDGEVLRIQNGYVVGITGTPTEWRQVSFAAMPQRPSEEAAVTKVIRSRDVMPGYKFGVTDQLTVRRLPTPPLSNYVNNPNVATTDKLEWFEAKEDSGKISPNRFAIANINGVPTAVYGEQCFSKEFCMTWQAWPSTPAKQAVKQ
jgi:hypothetical protein